LAHAASPAAPVTDTGADVLNGRIVRHLLLSW
jgi:hypothetical protein